MRFLTYPIILIEGDDIDPQEGTPTNSNKKRINKRFLRNIDKQIQDLSPDADHAEIAEEINRLKEIKKSKIWEMLKDLVDLETWT